VTRSQVRAAIFAILALFIGGFATLIKNQFQQTPLNRTVYVNTAAEIEKTISEGETVTIGFKSPWFVTIVQDKDKDGVVVDDGRRIQFLDIALIHEGSRPFLRGPLWSRSDPIAKAEKLITIGNRITITLPGRMDVQGTIRQITQDSITLENGEMVRKSDIASISKKLTFLERIHLTAIKIVLLPAWILIGGMAMLGYH
jgi:hypothetical protein